MRRAETGPETFAILNEEAIAERLVGETVILDPATDRYTRLNATGSCLWGVLEEKPAIAAVLAAGLAARSGIAESRALEEVVAFLEELERRGLVTLED